MKNSVTLGLLGKVLRVSSLFVFLLFLASCEKDSGVSPSPPSPPAPVKTVPGVPSIAEVKATSAGIVSVAVVAPTSDGGSPITGYTVISNPDNVTVTSTISSESNIILVSGLKDNGVEYEFTVKAVNSVGSSAPSAVSAKVVPADAKTNLLMYLKGWNQVEMESLLESENKWISYVIDDCRKDDVTVFKANGKGIIYQGTQKCNNLPDYEFNWAFNADKTKLNWKEAEPSTIDILNQDTLRLIVYGVNVKLRLTFKHAM